MSNLFTDPEDLTAAVVAKAKGYELPVMVPTMGEQLLALVRPGNCIGFRTESGSFYELSVYSNGVVRLIRIDEESDGIREVAAGRVTGAHDRDREVYGIVIEEAGGRQYKTSAVVKAWLSYDAVANRNHAEPADDEQRLIEAWV